MENHNDFDSERTSVAESSSLVHLAIGGMTCVSCVRAISDALSELDGVSNVTINLLAHSGEATVSRPSLVESIVNLIEDIGYECQVVSVSSLTTDKVSLEGKTRREVLIELKGQKSVYVF